MARISVFGPPICQGKVSANRHLYLSAALLGYTHFWRYARIYVRHPASRQLFYLGATNNLDSNGSVDDSNPHRLPCLQLRYLC